MITRVATLCACLLAIVAFVHVPSSSESPAIASALKSHHLFNLPEGMTEAVLAGALQEINHAIAESGHPDAGYRLWKVTGEQSGEYSYLYEGVWPDQATYDAIHESESWNQAVERHGSTFVPVFESHVYNRFIEIPTDGPGT
jgi:hypothetical protein